MYKVLPNSIKIVVIAKKQFLDSIIANIAVGAGIFVAWEPGADGDMAR